MPTITDAILRRVSVSTFEDRPLSADDRADLEEFISGVATPGGTTAAGMDVMRASDFKSVVAATLKAAALRSAELGA